MSVGTEDKLVYMANQIARNLGAEGEAAAVAATAEHIDMFWDPRMKAAIFAHGGEGLSPVANAAIESLKAQA